MLKSIIMLTILIFLIMAPEPDSKDLADMSANLLVVDNHAVLVAADEKQPE